MSFNHHTCGYSLYTTRCSDQYVLVLYFHSFLFFHFIFFFFCLIFSYSLRVQSHHRLSSSAEQFFSCSDQHRWCQSSSLASVAEPSSALSPSPLPLTLHHPNGPHLLLPPPPPRYVFLLI